MPNARRGAVLSIAALLLLVTACSNSNNAKNTAPSPSPSATAAATSVTALPAATIAPSGTGTPSAATGSPRPAASQAPAAAPKTGSSSGPALQVEQKLIPALLAANEAPAPLQLTVREAFNNHDYANGQQNAAQIEQGLNQEGRISGAVVRFSAPDAQTPPAGTAEITNLLVLLSTYGSPQNASSGMAAMLKSVTPTATNPHAVTITTQPVQLSKLGDETTASLIKVQAVLGGQPDTDVYVVGVRRGATTEVYVVTGVGGAPTVGDVQQIVAEQDGKVQPLV